MTQGPPPPQPQPLISGRIDTELSGSDITLGSVTLDDPSTGLPMGTTGGALDVHVSGPAPLPVTFTSPTQTPYLAAGTIASLIPAGGTVALAAALATTRLTCVAVSILPTAALTGVPSLSVEVHATGGAVLATGVVSGQSPLVIPLGSGALVGTAGALSLVYGANAGSLELHYTITGVNP
jgi:hypothetical protein